MQEKFESKREYYFVLLSCTISEVLEIKEYKNLKWDKYKKKRIN